MPCRLLYHWCIVVVHVAGFDVSSPSRLWGLLEADTNPRRCKDNADRGSRKSGNATAMRGSIVGKGRYN